MEGIAEIRWDDGKLNLNSIVGVKDLDKDLASEIDDNKSKIEEVEKRIDKINSENKTLEGFYSDFKTTKTKVDKYSNTTMSWQWDGDDDGEYYITGNGSFGGTSGSTYLMTSRNIQNIELEVTAPLISVRVYVDGSIASMGQYKVVNSDNFRNRVIVYEGKDQSRIIGSADWTLGSDGKMDVVCLCHSYSRYINIEVQWAMTWTGERFQNFNHPNFRWIVNYLGPQRIVSYTT